MRVAIVDDADGAAASLPGCVKKAAARRRQEGFACGEFQGTEVHVHEMKYS